MASDDTMTIHEDEDDDYHDHDQRHPHNLSRLSICTSSCQDQLEEGFGDDMMMMFMSGLSIESSYGDDEYSGDDHHKELLNIYGGASSDSDKEIGGSCLSLPDVPQQIQGSGVDVDVDDNSTIQSDAADKDYYCSESEGAGGKSGLRNNTRRNSRRRAIRERWLDREWEKKKHNKANQATDMCIDLGEMKGCRDLGFDLGNQRMLDLSSQISCSTIDTASSGTTSPIPSWRISSPGDDPKDVKERLKVWAQAVATSASRLIG